MKKTQNWLVRDRFAETFAVRADELTSTKDSVMFFLDEHLVCHVQDWVWYRIEPSAGE